MSVWAAFPGEEGKVDTGNSKKKGYHPSDRRGQADTGLKRRIPAGKGFTQPLQTTKRESSVTILKGVIKVWGRWERRKGPG